MREPYNDEPEDDEDALREEVARRMGPQSDFSGEKNPLSDPLAAKPGVFDPAKAAPEMNTPEQRMTFIVRRLADQLITNPAAPSAPQARPTDFKAVDPQGARTLNPGDSFAIPNGTSPSFTPFGLDQSRENRYSLVGPASRTYGDVFGPPEGVDLRELAKAIAHSFLTPTYGSAPKTLDPEYHTRDGRLFDPYDQDLNA